jgi:hypothetical protein
MTAQTRLFGGDRKGKEGKGMGYDDVMAGIRADLKRWEEGTKAWRKAKEHTDKCRRAFDGHRYISTGQGPQQISEHRYKWEKEHRRLEDALQEARQVE